MWTTKAMPSAPAEPVMVRTNVAFQLTCVDTATGDQMPLHWFVRPVVRLTLVGVVVLQAEAGVSCAAHVVLGHTVEPPGRWQPMMDPAGTQRVKSSMGAYGLHVGASSDAQAVPIAMEKLVRVRCHAAPPVAAVVPKKARPGPRASLRRSGPERTTGAAPPCAVLTLKMHVQAS